MKNFWFVVNRGAGFIQILEDNTKFDLILASIKKKTIGIVLKSFENFFFFKNPFWSSAV
jgi:hypothetical protein